MKGEKRSVKHIGSNYEKRKATSIRIRKDKRMEFLDRRHAPKEPPKIFAPEISNFDQAKLALETGNQAAKVKALSFIRSGFELREIPTILTIIRLKLLKLVIPALESIDVKMLIEALWIVTRISNSLYAHFVYDFKALPVLVNLLKHPEMEVRNITCYCLGNLTADQGQCAGKIIQHGGFDLLIDNALDEAVPMQHSANASWAVLCISRSNHLTPDEFKCTISGLMRLIGSNLDDVQKDAWWSLSYALSDKEEKIKVALESGMLEFCVKFLGISSPKKEGARAPAYRCIGNLLTGLDKKGKQNILQAGLFQQLLLRLEDSPRLVLKEILWCLLNVSADDDLVRNALLDENIIPKMIELANGPAGETKAEAAEFIANMLFSGSETQIYRVMECDDVFKTLVAQLQLNNLNLAMACLKGIACALATNKCDEYVTLLEECRGDETISDLMSNPNEDIVHIATQISRCCECDCDDDVMDSSPMGMEISDPTVTGVPITYSF